MHPYKLAVPASAILALTLSACAPEPEEKSYEVGVEDVGGGELQVADPQPGEIEVNLPETPMKNVPAEAEDAEGEDAEDDARESSD